MKTVYAVSVDSAEAFRRKNKELFRPSPSLRENLESYVLCHSGDHFAETKAVYESLDAAKEAADRIGSNARIYSSAIGSYWLIDLAYVDEYQLTDEEMEDDEYESLIDKVAGLDPLCIGTVYISPIQSYDLDKINDEDDE